MYKIYYSRKVFALLNDHPSYQASAQLDVNCRWSYPETKKFTGGRMDKRTNAVCHAPLES